MKIGLPKNFEKNAFLCEKSIEDAISGYKDLGAEIVRVSLPNINLSPPIYYIAVEIFCKPFEI